MKSILDSAGDATEVDGVPVKTLKRSLDLLLRNIEVSKMNDEWFVKRFGQIYDAVLALRKNEDFVVNPKQMDRFLDLVNFFLHNTDEDDVVEIEKTEPKQGFCGVTASFLVMTIRGDNVLSSVRF